MPGQNSLKKSTRRMCCFIFFQNLSFRCRKGRRLKSTATFFFLNLRNVTAFTAEKKLGAKIHVDHFIPWSFVKEDKLWNFVLSCPECNIKKSNILPPQNTIARILERNRIILNASDDRNNSKINLDGKEPAIISPLKSNEASNSL